jgi:hypothetical protein
LQVIEIGIDETYINSHQVSLSLCFSPPFEQGEYKNKLDSQEYVTVI